MSRRWVAAVLAGAVLAVAGCDGDDVVPPLRSTAKRMPGTVESAHKSGSHYKLKIRQADGNSFRVSVHRGDRVLCQDGDAWPGCLEGDQ